jgi:hypothetical protein
VSDREVGERRVGLASRKVVIGVRRPPPVKSDAAIGTRTYEMPIPPGAGANSSRMSVPRRRGVSLSQISQAEVSVIAAPNPCIV